MIRSLNGSKCTNSSGEVLQRRGMTTHSSMASHSYRASRACCVAAAYDNSTVAYLRCRSFQVPMKWVVEAETHVYQTFLLFTRPVEV